MDTGGIFTPVAWGAGQTALALLLCGLAQAEFARYQARRAVRPVDTPWVSTVAVWIMGAALTLPPAAVLAVAAVLHAHELFRGPPRQLGSALVSTFAATLASLVSSGDARTGVLAGLLYLAATDGPALLRGAWRLVAGAHPVVGRRGAAGDGVTLVALGVMLGLSMHFSPLAILFVLLPVSYLRRSAHGRALRHAAAHDPKTQLWNHAAWQTLSSAALASHRTRARSAVLMVDLDHFKRLNDTYGHRAGDDVLGSVAHVLQNTTRRNDIVARIGGEEFSILLPGVTEQEACQAAERIRDQIAALTVTTTNLHGHPTVINGITASIGVAATHRADTSVDDLLVNADRWLYQAKERGRNRVCGPLLAAAA
ncbi:GGDEF domain-containing protein [Actinophytocola sp.]|uniref:GGDEF domain-containing protein n=1 Tax=Actinophytocola sp. TaxID=1872138 RepID=UPI002ED13C2E